MNPHEGAAEAADAGGGGEARPVVRRGAHPGEVLGEVLEALSISLATFARQIAVPTSDVSRIVKGQRQQATLARLRGMLASA